MESSDPLMLALTTEADPGRAKALAARLLEQGLVACISLLPVTSLYRWEGKLCDEAEIQLLMKTRLSLLNALEQAVLQHHSYELPEWLTWPVTASEAYGSWVQKQLRPEPEQGDAEAPVP
jgi:periplasmic divalent cation tolerance protein